MPQMTSKKPRPEEARSRQSTFAGQESAAVSPPRYGIDFVDKHGSDFAGDSKTRAPKDSVFSAETTRVKASPPPHTLTLVSSRSGAGSTVTANGGSARRVPIPAGPRPERPLTGLARPALSGERSRGGISGVLPAAVRPVSMAAATPVVAAAPGVSKAPPSAQAQPPVPVLKAAAGAGPKARKEAIPSAAGVQAPSVMPAARPAAVSPEKSVAGPVGAKAAVVGAEAKAAAPEATAAPVPREAIAPAISAIRQRAAGARQHPPAAVPVASAKRPALTRRPSKLALPRRRP